MFFTSVLWRKVAELSVNAVSAAAKARSGMSLEQWKQFYVSKLSTEAQNQLRNINPVSNINTCKYMLNMTYMPLF